jgi:hypothetical protein
MAQLSDYGITRTVDGRIRSNGGEVRLPAALLWFPLSVEILHLPGSGDGDPEFWTEEAFEQYCMDMADDGAMPNGRHYDNFASCRD